MRRLYLIRHGKTEANEKRLYCGQTDLPLSEAGRKEIEGLVSEGIYPEISDMRFFTSGLRRTDETLTLIYGPVPRTPLPELAEYRFGEFEMQSYEDLKERAEYQSWIMDETEKIACPGGESREQFKERVIAGFKSIANKKNALVLCHGGVITCIMEYLYPGEKNFYEWQPATGRGYVLLCEGLLFPFIQICKQPR